LHAVHKQIDSFNNKPQLAASKPEIPIFLKNVTFVTGTSIVEGKDDVVKEIDLQPC
jgi:hypothetical protein